VAALWVLVGLASEANAQSSPPAKEKARVTIDSVKEKAGDKGREAAGEVKRQADAAKKQGQAVIRKSDPDSLLKKAQRTGEELGKRQLTDAQKQLEQVLDTAGVRRYAGDVQGQVKAKKDEIAGLGKAAEQKLKTARPDSVIKQQGRTQVDGLRTQAEREKQKGSELIKGLKDPDVDASWGTEGGRINSAQLESIKNWQAPNTDTQPGLGNLPVVNPALPGGVSDFSLPGFPNKPKTEMDGPQLPTPQIAEPEAIRHFKNTADSLTRKRVEWNEQWLQRINVQTILSDKQVRKLIDSLGLEKADSVYKRVSPLINKKELGARDMLAAINSSFASKLPQDSSAFNKDAVMESARGEALAELRTFNPNGFKLPDATLAELRPLSGNLVDEKYLNVVDSLRELNLRRQDLKLVSREFAEDQTEAIFKEKPGFWDKAYVDAIVGILSSGDATLFQASPALGYHVQKFLSVGVGPAITVQKANNSYFSMVGVRTFAKGEFWKQRAYGQVEYQVKPYRVNGESLLPQEGKWLVGGGYIQSITDRLGLNLEVLYRVNPPSPDVPSDSPWVFRIGLSTMKSRKP
jgi:hypothetical protein